MLLSWPWLAKKRAIHKQRKSSHFWEYCLFCPSIRWNFNLWSILWIVFPSDLVFTFCLSYLLLLYPVIQPLYLNGWRNDSLGVGCRPLVFDNSMYGFNSLLILLWSMIEEKYQKSSYFQLLYCGSLFFTKHPLKWNHHADGVKVFSWITKLLSLDVGKAESLKKIENGKKRRWP